VFLALTGRGTSEADDTDAVSNAEESNVS
jgi:hypothetical protein